VEKIYHHFLFLFLCSHDRVSVPHDLVCSGAHEGTYSRIGLGKPFSSENSIPQLTNPVVRHFNRKKAQKKELVKTFTRENKWKKKNFSTLSLNPTRPFITSKGATNFLKRSVEKITSLSIFFTLFSFR
jgi:hypothetical protein